MVEKLKNWVVQNIAIVITVMVVISIAILSCFMPDDMEEIVDKIFSYLGVVAIPLVVWYLGNQKELNEQKRLEEERLNQEKKEAAERECYISKELDKYKECFVSFIKKVIGSMYYQISSSSEPGIFQNWEEKLKANVLSSGLREILNGEDPKVVTDLLVKLDIFKWENELGGYSFIGVFDYKKSDNPQGFCGTLEAVLEKVENREYDIQIREFLKERYKK